MTRAKAQNPQKTKAWARPGRGRCRMTFDCSMHLGDEIPHAAAEVAEVEAGILFGFEDAVEDDPEAPPEEPGGSEDERGEEKFLPKREVLGLCQCEREQNHRRTSTTIHDGGSGRQCGPSSGARFPAAPPAAARIHWIGSFLESHALVHARLERGLGIIGIRKRVALVCLALGALLCRAEARSTPRRCA